MHSPNGIQVELSAQVERVKRRTRPWKSIIVLVLAIAAAVVVIGSEGQGLSAALRQRVTRIIAIPGYGRAESLNAAVAAGIVCDQLRARSAALTP